MTEILQSKKPSWEEQYAQNIYDGLVCGDAIPAQQPWEAALRKLKARSDLTASNVSRRRMRSITRSGNASPTVGYHALLGQNSAGRPTNSAHRNSGRRGSYRKAASACRNQRTLAGNKIYIVNYGSDNLSAFYPNSPDNLIRISLANGAKPFDLASRPGLLAGSDEIYVTESGLKQIAAIDTSRDKAIEFPAGVATPTFVAFSPDGCVAVTYDLDRREFAKIDPKRRSVFDSIQQLPREVSPPPVALRVDARLLVSLVLSDGSIQDTSYQASCAR